VTIRMLGTKSAALMLMLLSGCGGGGSDASSPCAGQAFAFTTTWTVTGGSYNPSGFGDQIVVANVGVQLSAKPVHAGVPQSCAGKGAYTLGNAAYPLPAGLTLNATTGEIAGTPTATADVSGGGTDTGMIRLTFPGYGSTRVLERLRIEQ